MDDKEVEGSSQISISCTVERSVVHETIYPGQDEISAITR